MNNFNQELIDFLKQGTCVFTCIKIIKEILLNQGYQELVENQDWDLKQDKYFIIRNDASLIAFQLNKKASKFKIVCTHADTPSFLIKPTPEYYENGYLKLNVAPYGGILNYGFMDRPMSIAGRIIMQNKNKYTKKIIDLKEAVAIIPSIAIHQNDSANSNLDLNTEVDLMPIISLNKKKTLEDLIKHYTNIKEKLFEYDLFLYNKEEPAIINNEFLASPRIDNLSCTYAGLTSFLKSKSEDINVFVVFNSEEIGSNTLEGADSNFLIDTLKKICANLELDLTTTLNQSIILNADNTHARHPNHEELSDYTNTPPLNSGIMIMKETSSSTNSVSATIFKHICENENIKYSYYTSRNDYATGSTLAGASLKHLSINSLDIGLVMLAMHSSYEVIGIKDTYLLYKALKKFYEIKYDIDNKEINFL
ncbi:MAG TPA: M18 family aminopeptidase [Candidatus Caccenecus avistercoris]|nr:M18 family aminopeptidase [Candidatus Caccenecus avistercoris]